MLRVFGISDIVANRDSFADLFHIRMISMHRYDVIKRTELRLQP